MDVGVQLDANGSPLFNSGFFERGILQGSDGVGGKEIKVRSSLLAYRSRLYAQYLDHELTLSSPSPALLQVIGNGHVHIVRPLACTKSWIPRN